jgi:uncharacterized protein (DUF488 family)
MPGTFYTIGHSTRSSDEFVALLTRFDVSLVVDVRRLPGSARYPQFNQDRLQITLAQNGIEYLRIEQLTGRRGKDRLADPATNAWWQNQSFHNYADWANGESFAEGLNTLIERAGERRAAIMCSEAVWWRCHRRIIADHLLAHDYTVVNIIDEHHADPATLSPGAQVGSHGRVTYPARK